MKPQQRKLAKLVNETELTAKRLKAIVEAMGQIESDADALAFATDPDHKTIKTDIAYNWPLCQECAGDMVVVKAQGFACTDCGWPNNAPATPLTVRERLDILEHLAKGAEGLGGRANEEFKGIMRNLNRLLDEAADNRRADIEDSP